MSLSAFLPKFVNWLHPPLTSLPSLYNQAQKKLTWIKLISVKKETRYKWKTTPVALNFTLVDTRSLIFYFLWYQTFAISNLTALQNSIYLFIYLFMYLFIYLFFIYSSLTANEIAVYNKKWLCIYTCSLTSTSKRWKNEKL